MIAGVMTAKVAWYIRKTFSGTVLASSWALPSRPRPKARDSDPMTVLRSPPPVKASE